MARMVFLPLLIAAGAASAQLTGAVGGAVGGATAGAKVAVGGVPDVAATAGGVTQGASSAIRGSLDATANTADRSLGGVRDTVGNSVKVEAGASVRVARGTRCWYEPERYYDPVYRDGYYYCERTGPGVAARVGTR